MTGFIGKVNGCPKCQKIMREDTRMTPLRLYHEVHKIKHEEDLIPPHKYIKITGDNINNIEHIKLMTLPEKMLLMNQIVHDPQCLCGEKPVMIHARHKRYLAFGRDF